MRSMAPDFEQITELRDLGIEKVIIFKNETKNEVQTEITNIVESGFETKNITHIPFLWQDLHGFREVCKMTVKALNIIIDSEAKIEQIFKKEMCGRDYEDGNKKKPAKVVNKIRETLTPTFIKMVQLLKQWQADVKSLDTVICPTDVEMLGQNLKCERAIVE